MLHLKLVLVAAVLAVGQALPLSSFYGTDEPTADSLLVGDLPSSDIAGGSLESPPPIQCEIKADHMREHGKVMKEITEMGVQVSLEIGEMVDQGTSVVLVCDNVFGLEGLQMVKCNADGQLSGILGNCKPKANEENNDGSKADVALNISKDENLLIVADLTNTKKSASKGDSATPIESSGNNEPIDDIKATDDQSEVYSSGSGSSSNEEAKDRNNFVKLAELIRANDKDGVSEILAENQHLINACLADVEGGKTLLMIAASNAESSEMAKFLLEKPNINIEQQGCNKELGNLTSLELTAKLGSEKVFELLTKFSSRLTPRAVELALNNGHKKIARKLIESGTDCNSTEACRTFRQKVLTEQIIEAIKNNQDDGVRAVLLRKNFQVDQVDDETGRSPLVIAASSGNLFAAKLLLDSKANPNKPSSDEKMYTPLMAAIENGHDDLAIVFIKRDDIEINAKNGEGLTALQMAVKLGRNRTWQTLLEEWAATLENCSSQYCLPAADVYRPLLIGAIANNKILLIQALINHKADVSIDVLSEALKSGHVDVFKTLLAVFNPEPEIRQNLLLNTVESGNVAMVQAVISKFGNGILESRNSDGETALQIAVRKNQSELAKFLLDSGADHLNCVSKQCFEVCGRMTPFEALKQAIESERSEVVTKMTTEFGSLAEIVTEDGNTVLLQSLEDEGMLRKMAAMTGVIEQMVNKANKLGETPLKKATKDSTVRLLINHGAEVSIDLLYVTLESGQVDVFKALLSALNPPTETVQKLFLDTVASGNVAMVQAVISKFGNGVLESRNSDGETALQIAVRKNQSELAKFLLDSGADHLNCVSKQCFKVCGRMTPFEALKQAIESERSEAVAKMTTEFGSLAEIVTEDRNTVLLQSLEDEGMLRKMAAMTGVIEQMVNKANKLDETPLKKATKDSTVRLLISHGADVSGCSHELCLQKLHDRLLAAVREEKIGEIDQLIGKSGAQVNFCYAEFGKENQTALAVAVQGNKHSAGEALIDSHGANPLIPSCGPNNVIIPFFKAVELGMADLTLLMLKKKPELTQETLPNGDNALVVAAKAGHRDLARSLSEMSEDSKDLCRVKLCLELFDLDSYTEMVAAIKHNKLYIVRQMLDDKYADIDRLDIHSELQGTILHLAVKHNRQDIVSLLLSAGADIEAKTATTQQHPLHIATTYGHVEMVELLLQKGADVDAQDYRKYTSLMYAANSGRLTIVKLLLGRGAKTNVQNYALETALHIAARSARVAELTVIVERSSLETINLKDSGRDGKGRTALIRAAEFGSRGRWWEADEARRAMAVLLDKKADRHDCVFSFCVENFQLYDKNDKKNQEQLMA